MDKKIKEFLENKIKFYENYEIKHSVDGKTAFKLITENGTEEEKQKILPTLDFKKRYIFIETRVREINVKRRIRDMIENKKSTAEIHKWIADLMIKQSKVKFPNNANHDSDKTGVPTS